MTENEQIQEMAEIISENKRCVGVNCDECEFLTIDDGVCQSCYPAKELYSKGYHKVERGEWIEKTHEWDFGAPWDYTDYTCSLCGTREQNKRPFCPNCGADMRGEEE